MTASFDEFAAQDPTGKANTGPWLLTLPEDVQEQCVNARLEHRAPWAQIVRYLKHLGYEDATKAKVQIGVDRILETVNKEA